MRIRRWRVARLRSKAFGGVEALTAFHLTQRHAQHTADRLNKLHDATQVQRGMLDMLSGTLKRYVWTPITDKELADLRYMNMVVDVKTETKPAKPAKRHPAGSKLNVVSAPVLADPVTLDGDITAGGSQFFAPHDKDVMEKTGKTYSSLCAREGECAGPYTSEGHCVHCGKATDVKGDGEDVPTASSDPPSFTETLGRSAERRGWPADNA